MRLLLSTRIRAAIVAMIAAGVGLALTAAVAALVHGQVGQLAVYLVVAAGLTAMATLVWRRVRWAAVVCMTALGGQVFGVVGTIWELTGTINAAKARQLELIGFDSTAAVAINLVYSSLGVAVFCWYAVAWRTGRAKTP